MHSRPKGTFALCLAPSRPFTCNQLQAHSQPTSHSKHSGATVHRMRSAEMAASERAADIAAIQESKRSLEAARIALNTPPLEREMDTSGVHTPPKATAQKRSSADLDRNDMPMPKSRSYPGHSRQNSRSNRMVDSASLMSALSREIGEGNRGSRSTTPTESPSRKRQRVYGDR